jgi:hypothetical protein
MSDVVGNGPCKIYNQKAFFHNLKEEEFTPYFRQTQKYSKKYAG